MRGISSVRVGKTRLWNSWGYNKLSFKTGSEKSEGWAGRATGKLGSGAASVKESMKRVRPKKGNLPE